MPGNLLEVFETDGMRASSWNILAGWIFCDYNQLACSLGYQDTQPGKVSWENCSNFVVSFRVLKSRMFPDEGEVELASLHAGARLNLGRGLRIINRHLELRQAIAQNDTKASSSDLLRVKCLTDEGS